MIPRLYKVNFNHRFFYLICNIFQNKTIFISPLDWGLGHATRCVPLIKQLMKNNVMILGVTKTTSAIFNEEFPDLKKVEIEPYNISYSKSFPLSLTLLLDSRRVLKVIKKERQQLQEIIRDYEIEVVISDNRFGLSGKQVECVYITHQLNIKAGVFSWLANQIHARYIKTFNKIWVPDFETENVSLAGDLSHRHRFKNVTYIGALSRLPLLEKTAKEFDYLCLLSGPEPLRSELEAVLIEKANQSQKKICIVRGSLEPLAFNIHSHVTVIDMPNAGRLSSLITNSDIVISRSGYSTLMDLYHLQHKNCMLIPTPGQPEQLYLAEYWNRKFGTCIMQQKDLHEFSF